MHLLCVSMNIYSSAAPAVSHEAPGSTRRLSVAVAGVTGYAGAELVAWLARHPAVRLTRLMAQSARAATPIARLVPALRGACDLAVEPLDPARIADEAPSVVFLALPDEASAELAPVLVDAGSLVIDLSGAFRLRDAAARGRWYPRTPALPDGVVYGLPERYAALLPGARLIANPGCYPTAVVLALWPLAAAGLIDGPIAIDAKSGVTGAGKGLTPETHFPECHDNVRAYNLFRHRHTPEMAQELPGFAVADLAFAPHVVPMNRGIHATIFARCRRRLTDEALAAAYARYDRAPFVRMTHPALPQVADTTRTNFCDIGWQLDEDGTRLIVVACLDNLVKGAAGQAIQNMNVALGLDERMGLL